MNILEEYLVRIGFHTDEPAFAHTRGVLALAEQEVKVHAGGMVKTLVEAQLGIAGVFTTLSAGILGLVDRVAMADQGYRLLGLRMMMTTESARKMDMITKALGADLPQIVWDPELHQRAALMAEDIDLMTRALGGDFESKMRSIRDIRYEFSRLEVATKFLGMSFASKLFSALGMGDARSTIHDWMTRFETNIDKIAGKLTDYAVPALKKTWEILVAAGEAGRTFGMMFSNIIGLLSGDTSIQGTEFSFDKLAKAIEHVGDWMKEFFGWITHAEKLLSHFASGTALLFSQKWAEAGKEFKAGLAELKTGSGGVIGAAVGAPFGPVGAAVGGVIGGTAGVMNEQRPWEERKIPDPGSVPESFEAYRARVGPSGWRSWLDDAQRFFQREEYNDQIDARFRAQWLQNELRKRKASGLTAEIGSQTSAAYTRADLLALIDAAADRYGVPRSLAEAVAQQESRTNANTPPSRKGAIGIMQLMPDTAKGLGVDPHDPAQNIGGGVRYLAQMLERYQGDWQRALAAYNAGPRRVDRTSKLEQLPAETRAYVPSVLRMQREIEQAQQKASSPPSQSPQEAAADTTTLPEPTRAPRPQAAVHPTAFQPELERRFRLSDIFDRDWTSTLAAFRMPPAPAPQMSHHQSTTSVDVGGIYITQPNADAQEIQQAVAAGIANALKDQTQADLMQLSPVFG